MFTFRVGGLILCATNQKVNTHMMKFKTKQKPHQAESFELMSNKRNYALYCKMRTGKSKMILDDAARHFELGRIDLLFIMCPNGIQQNWGLREIPKHMSCKHRAIAVTSSDGVKKKKELLDMVANIGPNHLTIIAINYEQLRKAPKRETDKFKFYKKLVAKHKTYVAADESHTLKSHNSQVTRGCTAIAKGAVIRRLATGTPEPLGPMDLYSQFRFLDPGILPFRTFTQFKNRYAVMREIDNQYYKEGVDHQSKAKLKIIVAFKNQPELKELVKDYVFSVTLEDCAEMPPVIKDNIHIDLTPQQKRIYSEILDQAVSSIENPPPHITDDEELIEWLLFSGEAKVSSPNGLVSAGKLLQICGGFLKDDDGTVHELDCNKFGVMNSIIEPLIKEEKFIIWATFIAELEFLIKKLGDLYGADSVVSYYGKTSSDDRTAAIEQFNDNPNVRFFIANQAACEGIDLSKSRMMFWYNMPPDNYRVYTQACARQMGMHQDKKIIINHLVTTGKRDARVVTSLEKKGEAETEMFFK